MGDGARPSRETPRHPQCQSNKHDHTLDPSIDHTSAHVSSRKPWRKVLYEEQPYGDNYTDASFLESLVVNAAVPGRDYWQVVKGSVAVVQQVNAAAAAVIAAVQLHEGLLSPLTLLALNSALVALLGLSCLAARERPPGGSLRRALRQATLLTLGVYLLSPLYGTLTRTISGDSIVALVAALIVLHLYLHDYNFGEEGLTRRAAGSMGVGAGVFAAVLLASRLKSDLQVFSHLLFSLQLFLLSPYLRAYLRRLSFASHLSAAALLLGVTTALLSRLSRLLASLHMAANLFLVFGCPAWLVRVHKFKAKINGPWDEAVPTVSLALTSDEEDGAAADDVIGGGGDDGSGERQGASLALTSDEEDGADADVIGGCNWDGSGAGQCASLMLASDEEDGEGGSGEEVKQRGGR